MSPWYDYTVIKALKTSVVVPARNEQEYIGDCLQSLLGQKLPFDEIIIVDNASTDETRSIIQGYARTHKHVTLLSEKKIGRHPAQATGFARAKGEWIVRIDADTRLAPDWNERLHKHIALRTEVSAWTGHAIFYDSVAPKFAGLLQAFVYQYLQYPAAKSWTLWGSAMAVRRSDLPKTSLSDAQLNELDEDTITSLLLKAEGKKVMYSSGLHAHASLRRGDTSLATTRAYLKTWPQDYRAVGQPHAAKYVTAVSWLVLVGTALNAFVTTAVKKLRA